MAEEKKKKMNRVGHRNNESNRVRRVRTEINKCEKKMASLLQRYEDKKSGGIKPDGERHQRLQVYINHLKSKLK